MSSISERQRVHAPLASANRLLTAFMATHAMNEDGAARVVLHAAEASAPAIVTLVPARRPGDMTPRYEVHWESELGGPFPIFDGILSIDADEDYDAFSLVIDGSYAPPGGIAGKMFDAVVGHRVAAATTRDFLARIRSEIEAGFALEEAAKSG